jgi:hypothetical protein
MGFYVAADSEHDAPNIHSFVSAATKVAVPIFSSLKSAEAAALWALENLEFLAQTDLESFVRQNEEAS